MGAFVLKTLDGEQVGSGTEYDDGAIIVTVGGPSGTTMTSGLNSRQDMFDKLSSWLTPVEVIWE